VQAFFDGGAAEKLGTGGFVVFDQTGKCATAWALFYGEELGTNNRAEARALQDLMAWLANHRTCWEGAPAIVIYGDSQLIINFCNRKARPSVGDLYAAIQEVERHKKTLGVPVFFRHVPRENNGLADWLTNVAR
jgi:ribonuclease HI